MKIKTEICDGEEEIIIRCNERSEKILQIENMLESLASSRREIALYSSGVEHYIAIKNILYFESSENKVRAHTRDAVFTTEYKLFELEEILPSSFVRVAKSAIVNIKQISYLKRELVGNGELGFKSSNKKTYFSRAYYRILKDKINEVRLGK